MAEESTSRTQLPVTLISGFLGAGKSTLLRNILEAKQADKDFKCAVLVNDMAELNIDKNLIESTGLVRSDEVISMQNGCVCCNLSGDLIEQIVGLTTNRETPFDYLIIEASGVSEPAAIAALFEECEDDHDHSEHPTSLFEVARMDTIVTVVDSADFLQNLDLMDDPDKTNYPRLLVDQVEYSNVVLLNKADLVSETQLKDVRDKVELLTEGRDTRVLTTENSVIDVKEVVDTKLYQSKDFDLSKFIQQFGSFDLKEKSCCKASKAKGESPCCRRARTINSGKSEVLLPSKKVRKTRHGDNYNITSFVYKARRPFLPHDLYENFIDKFFMSEDYEEEEEDSENGEEEKTQDEGDEQDDAAPPEKKKSKPLDAAEQKHIEAIQKMQEEGAQKKKVRTESIGSVLRMKGYMWQGNSHDLIGYISTAGNVSRIETPGRWACLEESSWKGTDEERQKIQDNWVAPYGDRRQELVFIGQDLKHEKIQQILDDCLLPDETMALGVDGWKAIFGDVVLDG
jgi:G3E family GTPase